MEVIDCKFNSYEEFLDLLKPREFLNKVYNNLIYRGQAIDWKLIPPTVGGLYKSPNRI